MFDLLLLMLAATAPVEARCRPAANRAMAMLAQADKATARADYRGANASLDAALKALGTGYAPPQAIDDTGMHLVLAESREQQGKPKVAAQLKRRILLERLALCRQPAAAAGRRRSPGG